MVRFSFMTRAARSCHASLSWGRKAREFYRSAAESVTSGNCTRSAADNDSAWVRGARKCSYARVYRGRLGATIQKTRAKKKPATGLGTGRAQ
jgi:hypothetical protein